MAGNRSSMASLIGIEPEREVELRAPNPPEAGAFLAPGDTQAVYVAAPVACKMRLAVGDDVSFVIQTAAGAVNSLDASVYGIFRKGAPWYDNAFYLPLPDAQSLFDAPGAATNVKVILNDGSPAAVRRAREAVARIVGDPRPAGIASGVSIRVERLDQAGRFYFSIIQANAAALLVLSSFLFAAAAVGIVNSMLMSVHERTREIGTVRALGLRRVLVVRLFVLEGFALGVVSAVARIALGGALVLHWGGQGIAMNTMTLAWLAGGDKLFLLLRPMSVAQAGIAIVAISTLSEFYPAFAASRLEPREALQHV